MEKTMDTTIIGYIFGLRRDNGRMEATTTGYVLGLCRDNGKENGNYYNSLYAGVL